MSVDAHAALARQVDELEALAAMYSAEGESTSSTQTASGIAVSVNIALRGEIITSGEISHVAGLHVVLPAMYPAIPPTDIEVSCPALSATEIQGIRSSLLAIASCAADDDRESLTELCQALQQEATQSLESRQEGSVASLQQGMAQSLSVSHPASSFGRRMVWFHHIKSFEKRKEIVRAARTNRLRGFCKPGFPGVLVVEGDEPGCEEFVRSIRNLKWQAMDVRWVQRLPEAPDGSQQLPDPFVELDEGAMGESAALCDAAGLLGAFRGSILKLDPPFGGGEDALPAPPLLGSGAFAIGGGGTDASTAAAAPSVLEELFLRIDHMNNAASYIKLLRRWTEQLGVCGGRLLHAAPDKGVPRRENVLCCLHAEGDALKAFLQRLRTQTVDVDRAGRPCKERQATVQWQRPLPAACAPLCGWGVVECGDGAAALRDALLAIGITEEDRLESLRKHSHDQRAPMKDVASAK